MDYDEIRSNVSKNLTILRKAHGLTQAQFGEMFAFSDKTISKWESGASIPDVATLVQIASKFNVSLDELVKSDPIQEEDETAVKAKFNFSVFQRVIILVLTIAIIWAVAGLAYIFTQEVFHKNLWPIFLWAIPLSSLCVEFTNKRYFRNVFIRIATESVMIWSVLIAFYYSFMKFNISFMPIFFLGIPLEIIVILNAMLVFWKGKDRPSSYKVQKEGKSKEKKSSEEKFEAKTDEEISDNDAS